MKDDSRSDDSLEAVASSWARMVAAAGATPRKTAGGTPASRAKGEDTKPISIADSRRRKGGGRVRQLNVKVTREFDTELRTLAKARKAGLAEMLETILAEWKAARQ